MGNASAPSQDLGKHDPEVNHQELMLRWGLVNKTCGTDVNVL